MANIIPLSVSDIRLLSGVRFTNDYNHIRWFDTQEEQNNYFNTRTILYETKNASFQRHDEGGMFKANANIEQLQTCSYMTFKNQSKTYYAFVTNLEYVNEKTTNVYFEIDMIQTYRFQLNFLPSPIVREHMQRYTNGKPNVNTIPEGLNYGDMYDTKQVTRIQPFEGIQFMVIVAKEPFHGNAPTGITPVKNGIPQGLTYYIHPFYASGGVPTIQVGGATLPNISTLENVLKGMFTQVEAVNQIVSMFVTDNPGLQITQVDSTTISFLSAQVEQVEFAYDGQIGFTLYVKNAPEYVTYTKNLGDKYSGVTQHAESKLMMYPYTVYVLTDLKGSQIEIRPEYVDGNDLKISMMGSMGTLNKTSYQVVGYNINEGLTNERFHNYNNGLISANPNLVPVLSDYLSAYIQGNANSIQASLNTTAFNGIMSGISGALSMGGSALKGNVAATTEGGLGVVSSVGNSVLQMQSIQAQIKDASNIPPSLGNQGSNVNFDYGNDFSGVFLIKKQLKPEYARTLSDFFKMYGYKSTQVKVPNLHTRQSWNFVQLGEANITGDMPTSYLNRIRRIFEKGVTLWHTNYMMDYSLSNGEI